MMKPFLPVLRSRDGGLPAMVAQMNRIENAARLAMADLGPEQPGGGIQAGMSLATKLGLVFALLTTTGLIAASLL